MPPLPPSIGTGPSPLLLPPAGKDSKSRFQKSLDLGRQGVKPAMLAHICNPSTRLKQDCHEFEARLEYILRHCLKSSFPTWCLTAHNKIGMPAFFRCVGCGVECISLCAAITMFLLAAFAPCAELSLWLHQLCFSGAFQGSESTCTDGR